jgi:RNA recognition motif-containing protein
MPSKIRPENITEEKRINVTNVSAKATKSQLQSFFNKFGKV